MKKKQSKTTSETKPTAKKVGAKPRKKTEGGGGRNSFKASPIEMDSVSENFSQCAEVTKEPVAPRHKNVQTAKRVQIPSDKTPTNDDQFVKQLGEAALNLLPGKKMMFSNSSEMWDSFLIHAKNEPDAAREDMMKMGQIIRGGVHSLVDWSSTAKHLPEVQTWAQTCLADMISWLEDFGFADLPRSPKKYGAAFQKRWKTLHPDGRGRSRFAVTKLFADELRCVSYTMLHDIMESYPAPLEKNAPPSKMALWRFVDGCVKWRFKEGDKFVDEQAVNHMFDVLRRSDVGEEIVWREHLWPLMQETWPKWIREPGREEFVGFGKLIIGLSLTTAKRKNEKLALEPSQWKAAVRGLIKRKVLFERLFHGDG